MNLRQHKRAARLYALAVIASMDCGGAEGEDQDAVVDLAIEDARRKIRAATGGVILGSLQACIDFVRENP